MHDGTPPRPTASTSCPLPSFDTDEQLLEALLRAESDALWRSFLARFERLIGAVILRAARQRGVRLARHELDDIRAGLVTHLLANDRRALRAFDPSRGLRLAAWIATIADHHAITCLRARRVRARRCAGGLDALREGLAARVPSPEELAMHKQLVERLRGAVDALGCRQRELFDLLFQNGLDAADVARRMGTSLQTVHASRHKLALRLRAAVHGELPAAGWSL